MPQPPSRFPRVPALLLVSLLLASLLRFGVWVGYRDSPAVVVTSDTHSYWKAAVNLVRFGAFTRSNAPPFDPDLERTPVYPLFLSACMLAFQSDFDAFAPMVDRANRLDFDPILVATARKIVFVQILLSLAALVLVWRIAEPVFGRAPAAFAALLLALDIPTAICMNNMMSEGLFCAILVAIMFWAKRLIDNPTRGMAWRLAVLGILAGALALCRPVAVYFFVFLAPFLFFKVLPKGRRTAGIAAFIVPVFLLTGAWVARNWARVGTPVFCSISVVDLHNYRAAWNQARIEGRSFDDLKAEFEKKTYAEGRSTEVERIRFMKREGLRILFSHPGLTALQGFEGLVKMATGISNSGLDYLWKPRSEWVTANNLNDPHSFSPRALYQWVFKGCPLWIVALKVWSAIHIVLLYVGIGVVAARFRRLGALQGDEAARARVIVGLCVVAIAYFVLVSVGAEASSRFRMPIAPALCLISGLGWAELLRRWPRCRSQDV